VVAARLGADRYFHRQVPTQTATNHVV
jgi:hypothetical protein